MSYLKNRCGVSAMIDYAISQNYVEDPQIGRKLLNRRLQNAKILHCRDLYSHYGCVNAVEFSNDGEWLVSGGDDKRVLLWNVNKALSGCCKPKSMKGEHHSNIFCLSFDPKHKRLFSAGNDEQVILHDVNTGETLDVFLHDEAVYGLSVDPVDENLFASACDDGRILIWDVRSSSTDAFILARYDAAFHAVMHNPAEPRLIATANAREGVGLWDIRKPRTCLMRYGRCMLAQSAMSVSFNKMGTHVLALRRRLPPVMYQLASSHPTAEFDHAEYYNSCTMKSCCFAGENDQYVLSGSDDFKLYMWKVPDNITTKKSQWINEAHLVLRGHRSIVNQVRYNSMFGILASSGVEKIIKLWSSFPFNGQLELDYLTDKDALRKVYSHEEYINLVLESGQFMTHDYSHHSVQEDPKMMAFFDSLVQRDIEGWTSDSSETSAITFNTCYEVQSTDSASSASSSSMTTMSSDEDESELEKLTDTWLIRRMSHSRRFSEGDLNTCPNNDNKTNSHSSRDLEGNLTSDKISQLIAKKRRDQMRRNTRATNKRRKRTKRSKMRGKVAQSVGSLLVDESTLVGARRMFNSVMRSKINDKRKLLQKKRARILRLSCLNDNSSDSDVAHVSNPPSTNSNIEVNLSLQNHSVSLQNGVSQENHSVSLENGTNQENHPISPQNGMSQGENTTCVNSTNFEDSITSSAFTPNGEINSTNISNGRTDSNALHNDTEHLESVSRDRPISEIPCVPHSSTNIPNGNNVSTISLDTNGSVFFQPKSGRHHSRNYRKRSAEDLQDDC